MTKLELQQHNTRLATENLDLRTKLAETNGNIEVLEQRLTKARTEIIEVNRWKKHFEEQARRNLILKTRAETELAELQNLRERAIAKARAATALTA